MEAASRTIRSPRRERLRSNVIVRSSRCALSRRNLVFVFVLLGSHVAALALELKSNLLHYAHQTWRTENGLPQNTVHSILQTHDGYIWMATEGGVVRFDGSHFLVYDRQNTPELRSNNIRALAEDKQGSLWAASADGLLRLAAGERTAFTTQEGLPSNDIWSLQYDRTGQLWIATTKGLARFENGHFVVVGNRSDLIGALAERQPGSLWVATQDGLKVLQHGALEDVTRSPLLKSHIEVLFHDGKNRLWVGTDTGLFVQNGANSLRYTTRDGLPSNRITALYQDRKGGVWVGTDSGGALIVNGKIERFAEGEPLSADMILSFYEDREGDLWAGTESDGVTILRDQKFITYSNAEGAAQDVVHCVFEDHAGVIWIGTSGEGLRRFSAGHFSTLTTKDGLASDQVFALGEDSQGALLVGTPDGLNRIQDGRISVLTSADGLADDFVRSIFRDRDGSLWIGTRRGLCHLVDRHVVTYSRRDGLASDLVGAVLRARNGDLWIGTLRGLSRLKDGKIRSFTTSDGLSGDVITTLYEDVRGILWIGTEDGGLNRYAGEKFVHLSPSLGLPPAIYGVTSEKLTASGVESLWISGSTGIFQTNVLELISQPESHGNPTVISYGASDGLRISECSGGGHPALWKAQNGDLWFATPKGAAVLHSKQARLNLVPPPVSIEGVSIDDYSFDPSALREVAPGHSRFSFEYSGLSFVSPQRVRFRYKLEGFDRSWIDAGSRRVAFYTNIPPGHYRFTVLARNNDGVWSERAASFPFRLLPHFYQTYWFAAAAIALLCVLAYGTYRWRVRDVEARFSAVLEERNRIAREIHDTLAQGFVAVSVQLEIVSRMLASSAEDARDHLNSARGMVRESLSEARAAIWALRSHSTEKEDLAARLSKMAHQATLSSQTKVRLEVRGTYRPLERDLEDELVRIGREAVTNAVRHADAENIDIELAFEVKRLRMTIADDGHGFAVEKINLSSAGHFGLQGMRERADRINADLTVKSTIGKGTKVSLEAAVN